MKDAGHRSCIEAALNHERGERIPVNNFALATAARSCGVDLDVARWDPKLSAKVAVITTTPLSMSVTLPFPSIVATSSSPEVQRTFPLPLSNFTPSCSVFSVSVMVTIPFSGTPVIERPVTGTSSVHAIAKIIDNDSIAIRRYPLILFVLFIFLHLFLYSILAMLHLHRISIISYGNLLFYK